MKHIRKLKKAFTLVELMVVITIIGILLGIIYPAFNAVKNRAYQSKCAANLKQLGGAINLYCADKKHWPLGYVDRSTLSAEEEAIIGPGSVWYHFIHPYLGGETTNIDYSVNEDKRMQEVINCPAVKPLTGKKLQVTYSSHPMIMGNPTDPNIPLRGVGIYPGFKRPNDQILMLDGLPVRHSAGPGDWVYGSFATFSGVPKATKAYEGIPADSSNIVAAATIWLDHNEAWDTLSGGWPHFRHSGDSMNTLRVDGHVENMPMADEDTGLATVEERHIMLNY